VLRRRRQGRSQYVGLGAWECLERMCSAATAALGDVWELSVWFCITARKRWSSMSRVDGILDST